MTPAEAQAVTLFRAHVAKLRGCSVFQPGKRTFTLHLASPNPVRPFEGMEPDEVSLALLTVRQLTMKKEPVCYLRICDVVERNCSRPELIPWVARAREKWNQVMQSSGTLAVLLEGGETITNERALNLYLCTGLFHTDLEKVELVDSLPAPVRGAVEMQAQSCMLDLFMCALLLDKIIHGWLDDPTSPVDPVPASAPAEAALATATKPRRVP